MELKKNEIMVICIIPADDTETKKKGQRKSLKKNPYLHQKVLHKIFWKGADKTFTPVSSQRLS